MARTQKPKEYFRTLGARDALFTRRITNPDGSTVTIKDPMTLEVGTNNRMTQAVEANSGRVARFPYTPQNELRAARNQMEYAADEDPERGTGAIGIGPLKFATLLNFIARGVKNVRCETCHQDVPYKYIERTWSTDPVTMQSVEHLRHNLDPSSPGFEKKRGGSSCRPVSEDSIDLSAPRDLL